MRNKKLADNEFLLDTFCDVGPLEIDPRQIERAISGGGILTVNHKEFRDFDRAVGIEKDRKARFERTLAGLVLLSGISSDSQLGEPNRVSTVPSHNQTLRQSLRILSMVSELHKVGYQKIRIAPGMSPSGTHWRCHITHSENVGLTGWKPLNWEVDVANYSSSDGERYFGWVDAPGKTARQLAALFIERFPDLAQKGIGRDRLYVGWFHEMFGAAEHGRLPVYFADHPLELELGEMPPTARSAIFDACSKKSKNGLASTGSGHY